VASAAAIFLYGIDSPAMVVAPSSVIPPGPLAVTRNAWSMLDPSRSASPIVSWSKFVP
jgi:hypothetical protein